MPKKVGKLVRRTINITEKQDAHLRKRYISLSPLVRKLLKKKIKVE